MASLILAKVQNTPVQSFDIQQVTLCQNVCLKKVSFTEHSFKWPITISVAGRSTLFFFFPSFLYIYLYELSHWPYGPIEKEDKNLHPIKGELKSRKFD